MDARTAVLTLIAIKSYPLKDLVNRFPYAKPTVYEAVRRLEEEGLLNVKDGLVSIAKGYRARKMADINILSLSHGIDPEFLMKKSTISIWSSLEKSASYKDIQERTGYSHVTVKKAVTFLRQNKLLTTLKERPILAVRDDTHPVNRSLKALLKKEETGDVFHYPGTIPFKEHLRTPGEIERILFERIDDSIAVRGTGFLVRDESGEIIILESVGTEIPREEFFLGKLLTTEGAEDLCIKMITYGNLDLNRVLSLSIERDLSSLVGCYLEIVNDIGDILPDGVIDTFSQRPSRKRHIFLKEEKGHGKSGWENRYEEKWNIDLYLDLDAIKHGVRSA